MNLKQLPYLLILICLLGGFNSYSQVVFEKRIPIANNLVETGRCILPTDDGGYLITGETNSKSGNYDVCLLKLDASGDTLWTKTYGGPSNDKGKVILKTKDNNYMIIGSTSSYGAGAPDYYNFYFIKVNSSGDTLFTRTYDYLNNDVAISAIETSDQGFLVVGHNWTLGSYNTGMVVKVDAMAKFEWMGTISSSANSYINSCIETETGDYLVVGSSIGSGTFDLNINRYSSAGKLLQTKTYDNGGNAEGGGKIVKWPGGGYVVGSITGNYYGYSGYFVKLNNQLVRERSKVISEIQSRIENDVYDLLITPDTNIVIAGYDYNYNKENSLRIAKYDSSFNFKWLMDLGLPNQVDYGYSIKPTGDGAFIVSGTADYSPDGDGDVYILKVLDNKCKVPERPVINSSVTGAICAGKPVTFTINSGNLNGGTEWKWYKAGCGGSFVGSGSSITVNATSTENYYARGEGGCVIYSPCGSKGVTVNNLPNVYAGQDQSLCLGSYTTLTAYGAKTYKWDHGIGNGGFLIPTSTKTYTVTGTDANGCVNTDQVVVTVNPLPIVSAGPNKTICNGESVTLSGTGATSYTWNNNVIDGEAFFPTKTQTYTVEGTDANNCKNNANVTVTVNVCTDILNESTQSFSLYPNPSQDFVQINSKVNFNRIAIFNSSSKLMVNEIFFKVTSRNLRTNLPKGIYEIVLFDDLNIVGREKLVVQ